MLDTSQITPQNSSEEKDEEKLEDILSTPQKSPETGSNRNITPRKLANYSSTPKNINSEKEQLTLHHTNII